MNRPSTAAMQHPLVSRRTAVQAGAIGLLGFGMNHLGALRSEAAPRSETAMSNSGGKAQVGDLYLSLWRIEPTRKFRSQTGCT